MISLPDLVDKLLRTMTVRKRQESRRRQSVLTRYCRKCWMYVARFVATMTNVQLGHTLEEKHELLMIVEENLNLSLTRRRYMCNRTASRIVSSGWCHRQNLSATRTIRSNHISFKQYHRFCSRTISNNFSKFFRRMARWRAFKQFV